MTEDEGGSSLRAEIWLSGRSPKGCEDTDAHELANFLRQCAPLNFYLRNAFGVATKPFFGREEEGPEPIALLACDYIADPIAPSSDQAANDAEFNYEHKVYVRLVITPRGRRRPPNWLRSVVSQQDFLKALDLADRYTLPACLQPDSLPALRAFNRRVFSELVRCRIDTDRLLRNAIADAVDPLATTPIRLRIQRRARRAVGGQPFTNLKNQMLEASAEAHTTFKTSAISGYNRFNKEQMKVAEDRLGRGERTIRDRVKAAQKRPKSSSKK